MGRNAKTTAVDIRAVRRLAGLNQSDFWSRIGVTQSGGSRYESGRNIPKPVMKLIELTYLLTPGKAANELAKLRGDDLKAA